MLQHTNQTILQRESSLENQHTASAACDTAEQLPHLQRVVMYTPPFFFISATAYSYSFLAGNSRPTYGLCSMRHSRTVATPAESSHVHPTFFLISATAYSYSFLAGNSRPI
uniref:Uncharacterized protein n=1 Tax=Rhipicephalus microplus TaxID=6941 RepID=A0A6G5AH20_RHIMP